MQKQAVKEERAKSLLSRRMSRFTIGLNETMQHQITKLDKTHINESGAAENPERVGTLLMKTDKNIKML